MKLFMVRHGESENNLKKIWTGWADPPLTQKGYEDALLAASFLKGIRFDKVYASDLVRAIETGRTALPECEPIPTPLLREIDLGELAGRPLDCVTQEDRALMGTEGYARWKGETREEFICRLRSFFAQMEQEEGENIAAFAHAGILKEALRQVLGYPLAGNKFKCNNCAVAVFEYCEGIWSLHSWINHL